MVLMIGLSVLATKNNSFKKTIKASCRFCLLCAVLPSLLLLLRTVLKIFDKIFRFCHDIENTQETLHQNGYYCFLSYVSQALLKVECLF